MNTPTMYHLKPVVHFSDMVTVMPTSTSPMYSMKNIYSPSHSTSPESQDLTILPNISEQVNKILQKPSEEVEKLEKRQEAILKQLNYLKEQMLVLREELANKCTTGTSSPERATNCLNNSTLVEHPWTGLPGEVVVHASPEHPPYSLLAVGRVWPGLRLRVTCHAHSSVTAMSDHLTNFNIHPHTLPSLHMRLVWKQMGPDCELIISPLTHCPIRGEVNLLRYLYRSMTSNQDPVREGQLDSVLDICHRLSHAHTLRDKQLGVRALNALLGKTQWLLGDGMSVADVAAWSVLRAVSGVELSQNMSKWQGRCAAAFEAEAA